MWWLIISIYTVFCPRTENYMKEKTRSDLFCRRRKIKPICRQQGGTIELYREILICFRFVSFDIPTSNVQIKPHEDWSFRCQLLLLYNIDISHFLIRLSQKRNPKRFNTRVHNEKVEIILRKVYNTLLFFPYVSTNLCIIRVNFSHVTEKLSQFRALDYLSHACT